MEETAEVFEEVVEALAECGQGQDPALNHMASTIRQVAKMNRAAAVTLRAASSNIKPFTFVLSHDRVRALLHESTDVMVVAAGFGLACGFPAAAAYEESVCSNLSKANPATGKIDKDASGKWIKGPEFFKPNFDRILVEHGRG
jgi:phage-related minor tail protein